MWSEIFVGMTPFGFFHTIVSLAAIPFGTYAYFRHGQISAYNGAGKGYLITMLIGCLTAFGIYHHGGFTIGHVLSIVTLAFLGAGYAADTKKMFGAAAAYVQIVCYAVTYFLLWFFTTTETLTRVPAGHAFAKAPDDPALAPLRGVMLLLFLAGIGYQVFRLRSAKQKPVE